ncbi:unnamed protein product [Durusdinium trenchii]|uniref:Uncharacterized protein n=1 Tax=Durusdinium trenchii TaxID=1381693 RepID=A0ABP0QD38_9DINO
MPAFEPLNLTAYNEDLYTFEASWEPNDPKACIFQYWDVQAKVNGTDWPDGDDPPVFGCRVLERSTTNCTVHVGINSGVHFEWRVREACTVRRLFTNWVYYDGLVLTRLPDPASQPQNLSAFSISPSHEISYTSLNVSWDALPPGECIFTGWKVETSITGETTNWQESTECRANPREPFSCTITTGLLSNVYYDMRISETCVDPNAEGEALVVYSIARTRPVPAVAPVLVSVFATSARSLGVSFMQQSAGQCIFQGYAMQWQLQGWDYWLSDADCLPRAASLCSVTGFPSSQSYYTVRMMETCSDPLADSPWVEWPEFIQTWPEPAQAPSNFTFVELTAYNVTFSFEPGLGLDCTWASWQVQMLQDFINPLSDWTDLADCSALPFRENVTCSILGLQSNSEYQVRVRETCTNYIYDSDWGYSPRFFSSMPVQAALPQDLKVVPNSITAFFFDVSWVAGPAGQCVFKEWVMEVFQISPDPGDWALPPLVHLLDEPHTWVRHKCTAGRESPLCRPGDLPRSLKQNSTYSVRIKETCVDPNADSDFTILDVNVTTVIAIERAEAPANLTVSNETAYTFLLEFDAGAPHDCYFTGWDVEVRENWTMEVNISNETNYTEVNYSLWVPRRECQEEDLFPRHRMRCVVPRLRKHSLYDAKVRETCYDGYTYDLDSDFSDELPNRQAETEVPEAATTPFGLESFEPGPYSFSLRWFAGDPQDCLYMKWLVEIRDNNFTGGEWREAIECGRQERGVTSCTITELHGGYLGEEAHVRSNTEYEVRVKEACETYTSIYEPWGGARERAQYLDSPIFYLASNALPRTLVPVPTLTPSQFEVYDVDHQSFRLSWQAPASNDCRFRNWTVEIQRAIQCISGPGYTNCTDVENDPWTIPSSCVIEDRSITSCQVYGVTSYAFYNVRMRERCSDGTAESDDASLVAEIWPFLADAPENLTVTSPEPFTLNLKWVPGSSQECVFSHWDVQVQGRRYGDLVDRFSRESVTEKWYGEIFDLENYTLNWSSTVASCRLEGQREVAECNVSGLISNALYDVRIAERCVDSRADSPWTVQGLKATIPAWALTPLGPNITNVTTTSMDLEWAASEPRDCLFLSWKVEVKPVAIALDAWIPVPECSLPDRSVTFCRIVGLQSYTSYDLRVQETCIHNTSDSPYLLDERSFTTDVGQVIYVGTNPDTNSKAIYFGSQGLNACAYHTKCCQDEFSLCYGTDQVEVIRTDLADAGWGQDLYLSCVADTVSQDEMKRIVAQPPATLEAVGRTANSIDLVWLPFGSGGYMSDCYCSVWNIFIRRQGTTEWLLSPDCNNMPFQQSSCTVQELEGNWLFPDTQYEIRVRQTCSLDRLSSPYVEIQVPTLPGCSFSQHSGRDDFFVCADGFESNIFEGGRFDGDGIGCWRRGGRAKCSKNFPYMCASPDSCAKVDSAVEGGVRADHCCMPEPCGNRNGGDRVCIVRPNPPTNLVVTSTTPDSLNIDWQEQDFADPTFYPCNFRRWQVDLSQYYFEHWSSQWTSAAACFIEDRRLTSCTVTGLVSNAQYYVRIREVCQDDDLNGDFENYPSLAQVNPLPSSAVTGVYDVQREPFWIHVAWTPGIPNDCIHVGWEITAAAGMEFHTFTTDGQPRENAYQNMTGLTDGVSYEVSVHEVCENPLANSEATIITISTKPEAAGAPVQPSVSAAGPYWMFLEWQAGSKGRCTFLHWDVQSRKTGTDMFHTAALCTEQPESATSCNVTETFACYKDKTYSGFYDVCIPNVECPLTSIENVTACQLACSLQPACRALRYQAAYGHCYLIDSSYNQLDDNPLYETTGCARNLGLESLTGYELEVAKRCEDPEADSSFVSIQPGLVSNQTTVAAATQPEDVAVEAVFGVTMRLSFTPGALRDFMPIRADGPRLEMDDSTDCVFQQWSFQVMLNKSEAPSDGPVSCWQFPMVCDQVWHTVPSHCADNLRDTAWCDVRVYWSQELYQLRMREECVDPMANSPYINQPLWVVSGVAMAAESVENFTVTVGIVDYNISLTFDWDAGEDNDCIFTGWELQLRAEDSDWEDMHHCTDARKEDVNCTLTEGISSQTTYDARVRAFCLDPLTKSNWTEMMRMFTTPAIPADAPLVSLLTMGPHEMWFSLEPQELRDCISLGFASHLQASSWVEVMPSENSSDMRSVNESILCLPQNRESTQCMLQGLQSNTTYFVRICEFCKNPEAQSCGEASNTTALLSPDAPWSFQVARTMEHAMITFISGMVPGDCIGTGWAIEYFNESWQPLGTCPRSPGAGTEQQCLIYTGALLPEQHYWMRVQEICGAVSPPFVNFSLPQIPPQVPFEVDLINISNKSNASEMEDMMDGMHNDMPVNSTYGNGSYNGSTMMWMMDDEDVENTTDIGNETFNESVGEFAHQPTMDLAKDDNESVNDSVDRDDNEFVNGTNATSSEWMYEHDMDAENESAYEDDNESVNSTQNASSNGSLATGDAGVEDQSVGAQSRMACQDTSDCSWILGDWSSCSSTCGAGTQTRSISCQSGFIEDCPKPMPESSMDCYSTELCSWEPSTLTECNTTCGAGTQDQSWSCPSGSATDCGPEPETSQVACYETAGCVWLASDWGDCSSRCGHGTRTRNVSCSGPLEADCGRARPDSREVCQDISECNWTTSEWSSCNTFCGSGFRVRQVSCPSGVESDCSDAKPTAIEECREVGSCQWLVSSWSACSSSCGNGSVTRTVSCQSGLQADCSEPEPASEDACFSSACNWTVTDWSSCNVTCGSGFQEREALCPASTCVGDLPATLQSCVGRSECTWQVGEWGPCSTSCGTGMRNRSLSCPSEYIEDCGDLPAAFELCTSYSGCEWQVGEWSQCDGSGCGQRVRAVYCQSGQAQDCVADQPANITTCDLQVCMEVTEESASFDLVLEVDSETNVEGVKESLQEAVAESLNVDVEAVSVEIADGRRLASTRSLQFLVQVRDVTKGLSEFLSSESSLGAVAQDVVKELEATGINAAVQISVRLETTTLPMTTTTSAATTPVSSVAATSVTSESTSSMPFTSSSSVGKALNAESSTAQETSVTKSTSSAASTSAAMVVKVGEEATLSADPEDAHAPQDFVMIPVVGLSLAALVIFGGLIWRGRHRQLHTARPSPTKGAWTSTEIRMNLYPWDYAADTLAGMIWTTVKVHAELEEEVPHASQSPTNGCGSLVAQSPNPAPSEPPSLSGSFGSEAGQAVVAAASQVRTVCTVAGAAAQMNQAGFSQDDESTRPSSGTSGKSQADTSTALPSIPVPAIPTTLRAAASTRQDTTLAPYDLSRPDPSQPSRPSKTHKPSITSFHSTAHLPMPPAISHQDASPSSLSSFGGSPTVRPPKGSPVVSVRVNRRQELPSSSSQPPPNTLDVPGASKGAGTSSSGEVDRERKDSWESSRTPISESPRSETGSPPRRIPRHMVRAVAASPMSPSDSESRRSHSARRVPARPSDCWPPPQPR